MFVTGIDNMLGNLCQNSYFLPFWVTNYNYKSLSHSVITEIKICFYFFFLEYKSLSGLF